LDYKSVTGVVDLTHYIVGDFLGVKRIDNTLLNLSNALNDYLKLT